LAEIGRLRSSGAMTKVMSAAEAEAKLSDLLDPMSEEDLSAREGAPTDRGGVLKGAKRARACCSTPTR
jgi:hypothetical protein